MIHMQKHDKTIVERCLQGQECKECLYCNAEKETWNQVEQDLAEKRSNYIDDLNRYYTVKGKRMNYERTQKGAYMDLAEPEELSMLSRY